MTRWLFLGLLLYIVAAASAQTYSPDLRPGDSVQQNKDFFDKQDIRLLNQALSREQFGNNLQFPKKRQYRIEDTELEFPTDQDRLLFEHSLRAELKALKANTVDPTWIQERPPGVGPIVNPLENPPIVPLADGDHRTIIGVEGCSNSIVENYSKAPKDGIIHSHYRTLAEKFNSNCWPDLLEIEGKGSLAATFLSDATHIQNRVLLLDNMGPGPKNTCTAMLLSAETILTAAHCFRTSSDAIFDVAADVSAYIVQAQDGRRVSVSQIISHGNDLKKGLPETPISESDLAADVVIAKLRQPLAENTLEPLSIHPDALEAGVPLVLFGRRPRINRSGSTEKIVVLRGSGCRLMVHAAQQEDRLLNQCLTEPGMSGGPIFAERADGTLQFVGIHQAVAVNVRESNSRIGICRIAAEWCDDSLQQLLFLNVGVRVKLRESI